MRQREWLVVLIVFLTGACVGLISAAALIPEQPDVVYIPVERPAAPAVNNGTVTA